MKVVFPAVLILILFAVAGFVITNQIETPPQIVINTATTTQPAGAAQTQQATTTSATSTKSSTSTLPVATSTATTTPKKPANKPKSRPVAKPTPPPPPVLAERAPERYDTPPESFEKIDEPTRAALVNILCMPQSGTLRPISGSGVIIGPRGVILTNAHVAQYVLLSQSPQINLNCTIRTGSPATPRYKAITLYIPPVWVNEHYQEISSTNRTSGTGEHDYALLLIKYDLQGNLASGPFPYLSVETRENVAFQGDNALVAGYPAEFVGGIVTQQNLYAATSITSIKQLLTFKTESIDVFSIGGVIQAQGGASGGPLVNAWRKVVGIIVTTSEGTTTDKRDLHVLNANYIDRDLVAQTSKGLNAILAGNVGDLAAQFSRETGTQLVQKYIDLLINH